MKNSGTPSTVMKVTLFSPFASDRPLGGSSSSICGSRLGYLGAAASHKLLNARHLLVHDASLHAPLHGRLQHRDGGHILPGEPARRPAHPPHPRGHSRAPRPPAARAETHFRNMTATEMDSRMAGPISRMHFACAVEFRARGERRVWWQRCRGLAAAPLGVRMAAVNDAAVAAAAASSVLAAEDVAAQRSLLAHAVRLAAAARAAAAAGGGGGGGGGEEAACVMGMTAGGLTVWPGASPSMAAGLSTSAAVPALAAAIAAGANALPVRRPCRYAFAYAGICIAEYAYAVGCCAAARGRAGSVHDRAASARR